MRYLVLGRFNDLNIEYFICLCVYYLYVYELVRDNVIIFSIYIFLNKKSYGEV